MRKLAAMTTVVACAVIFLATASMSQAAKQKSRKGGGAATTVTGCLQKGNEANTYMLTNVAGGGSYEVIGAPANVNLAPHVGHKIDVTGRAVAANKAAKAEGVKGAAKKAERGERHLQVQSFKMVAPSCP